MTEFSVRFLDPREFSLLDDLLAAHLGGPVPSGFSACPFGEPLIAAAFCAERPVAHYTVFPQPVLVGDELLLTYKGGPYTLPEYRGQGLYVLTAEIFAAVDSRKAAHIGFPNEVHSFLHRMGGTALALLVHCETPVPSDFPVTPVTAREVSPAELAQWFTPWFQGIARPDVRQPMRTVEHYQWLQRIWIDRGKGAQPSFQLILEEAGQLQAVALCQLHDGGDLFHVVDLVASPDLAVRSSLLVALSQVANRYGAKLFRFAADEVISRSVLAVLGGHERKRYHFWFYPPALAEQEPRAWCLTLYDQLMS